MEKAENNLVADNVHDHVQNHKVVGIPVRKQVVVVLALAHNVVALWWRVLVVIGGVVIGVVVAVIGVVALGSRFIVESSLAQTPRGKPTLCSRSLQEGRGVCWRGVIERLSPGQSPLLPLWANVFEPAAVNNFMC